MTDTAGSRSDSLCICQFGDEYRPCKLTKFVYGFPRKKDQNDFMFARVLDYRLYGILKDHSVDKPVLVFCPTRKGDYLDGTLCIT